MPCAYRSGSKSISKNTPIREAARTASKAQSNRNAPKGSACAIPLLPENPVIKIRRSRTWVIVDLRDFWFHRQLFYFFVWRDLKVRYRQTILGAAWVILQPLLMTLTFVVFVNFIVRGNPSDTVPYPLFLYSALLAWTFFSNAVSSSSYSLTTSASMITKVYFPRMIVPAASIVVRLVDFFVAAIILLGLGIYYRVYPTWGVLLMPLLIIDLTLLALGMGLMISALNAKYRDIGTILPVALQLWLYLSPIVYPAKLVSSRWRQLYDLNPLVGIIENLRASLFGLPFQFRTLACSFVITLALLLCSAYLFPRIEDEFADLI